MIALQSIDRDTSRGHLSPSKIWIGLWKFLPTDSRSSMEQLPAYIQEPEVRWKESEPNVLILFFFLWLLLNTTQPWFQVLSPLRNRWEILRRERREANFFYIVLLADAFTPSSSLLWEAAVSLRNRKTFWAFGRYIKLEFQCIYSKFWALFKAGGT